ncbi:hypothetical protein [Chryseobacterium sp. ERMR1:04]|uniref:hypothetical protein n=1 Tax=Chryseobacterium sp. ERMR1:04 TaxID=1705393 RepID=UPI0006C8BBFE|nr:hypothetical protein [Chryseobacterium sp. ERMR1:04]KPH11279.1 hypothetical protein AMQ68_17785 [Chryseobacterium sp. ERMR1:04]
MKKFLPILLLAFVSLFIFSCDNRDDNVQYKDSDTVAVMKDATGSFISSEGYKLIMDISIENTDVVLVYRRDPNASNAWQLIPKTYYLSGGRQLDYNFLFSTKEVEIYTDRIDYNTLSTSERNQFLNNQTFRVVLVPANATGQHAKKAAVDYSDYNAVVKYYNLNDSNVTNTKVN